MDTVLHWIEFFAFVTAFIQRQEAQAEIPLKGKFLCESWFGNVSISTQVGKESSYVCMHTNVWLLWFIHLENAMTAFRGH